MKKKDDVMYYWRKMLFVLRGGSTLPALQTPSNHKLIAQVLTKTDVQRCAFAEHTFIRAVNILKKQSLFRRRSFKIMMR